VRLPSPNSIRARLLLIAAAISLLTLTIASTLFVATDLHLLRRQMVRDLEVLAEAVGDNCLSALVFDAPETAEKNLESLRREYQIRSAVLYDAQDRPFAQYRRDPGPPEHAPAGSGDGVRLEVSLLGVGFVEVSRVLTLDGHPIGRIFIHARTDELAAQLRRYAGPVGLLLLGSLAASLALALRLHGRVADPILHLAAKTREISARGDYGVRVAEPQCDAEIAELIRGFNAMLAEIERRDAALASRAKALDRANVKLRALTTEIALVEERERKRLAAELHDSAMQKLAIAQMQVAAVTEGSEPGQGTVADERLEAGLVLIREALGELRGLQFELSPPALYLGGLPQALESLAAHVRARFGVAIEYVESSQLPPLPEDLAVVLYQCARELLFNLVKHAKARRGAIALRASGDRLELVVEDDGVGFAGGAGTRAADAEGGSGLYSIGERLAVLGGQIDVWSGPQGSRVALSVPIAAQVSAAPRQDPRAPAPPGDGGPNP
jgi:signal transduction histidine kinase